MISKMTSQFTLWILARKSSNVNVEFVRNHLFQIVFYVDCSNCDDTVSYIKGLITPEIQEFAINAIEGWLNCPDDGAICDLNPDELIEFLDNFDFCGVLQNHPQGDDVCYFIDQLLQSFPM